MPQRVRTPPIFTLRYAPALSKGNRAFALRARRSNRALGRQEKTLRALETPVTSLKKRVAMQVSRCACSRWKTGAGG